MKNLIATTILVLVALSCQKEKLPQQNSLLAQSLNITTALVAATPQLLTKDDNFIAVANMNVTILNGLANKNIPYIMQDTLTLSQYQTMVTRMGFADTTAYNAFLLNMKFKYALLKKTYGTSLNQSVIAEAIDIIREENLSGNPEACKLKYEDCMDGVETTFNTAMWLCLMGGLTGSAATTPIGGGLILVGCGTVATRNAYVGMRQCARRWDICLMEKYEYPDEQEPIFNVPDNFIFQPIKRVIGG